MLRLLFLPLRRAYEYVALYLALGGLASACMTLTVFSLALKPLLPKPLGRRVGRWAICLSLRFYLFNLSLLCACRFDLKELDRLRDAGPLVIAPNHPGLLDAFMVLSRLPDAVVVLKASLIDNFFLGAVARLAGYIRNDWVIGMVHRAVDELRTGSQLLMFPEGTRTTRDPVNHFKGGTALIAARAKAPVQTVFIEQNTDFLGKNWPFFRRPDLPMRFSVRLGRRFDPPRDADTFTKELQAYFEAEIRARRQEQNAKSASGTL